MLAGELVEGGVDGSDVHVAAAAAVTRNPGGLAGNYLGESVLDLRPGHLFKSNVESVGLFLLLTICGVAATTAPPLLAIASDTRFDRL